LVTSCTTAVGFESPSLASPGDGAGAAYELKFLLDEARAQEVEAWARRRLTLDPHGDPALGGAYRTTSLYFDTPELDVYHRSPSYKRRKYRVRRYGALPWLFLERKTKWGDRVQKRRTGVPDADLRLLAHPLSLVDWPGHWFHRRLLARRLGPACRIAYQRTAYAGTSADGPLRLTLDRRVRGLLTTAWDLTPFDGGLPLLTGQVILEFKFRSALPVLFKEIIAAFRLSPRTVSKYRLCRGAWGAPASLREAADA
jgi:VTC domain